MRRRRLLTAVVAAALIPIFGSVGIAAAQSEPDESYWGEHTLNGFVSAAPAAAIAVCSVPLAAAILGFLELDRGTVVFLLAAIAFLAYHFYWQPHARVSRSGAPRQPDVYAHRGQRRPFDQGLGRGAPI